MSNEEIKGISRKPVSAILNNWETRTAAVRSMASPDLAESLSIQNPYVIFATLAELFDNCDYASNLGEDEHIRLSMKLQEMAVRAGRKEGAI